MNYKDSVNNEFQVNERTELVLIRSAEAAPYLTVGTKSYLGDQLVGKRNGQVYQFVIRDAGEYVTGIDITGHKSTLKERPVEFKIQEGNIAIDTDILVKASVDFDKEIAQPNGEKLAKGLVKDVMDADLGKQNTAFVGQGWLPLFKASNYLESISSEAQYAFFDPMIHSIARSSGKAYEPAGDVEPIYRKGLKGTIGEAEVRSQQGFKVVEISEDLANELSSATVASYASGDKVDTITLNNVTETIPAGTPLFIAGVKACDLVGEATSAPKAFIAIEDGAAGVVKVRHVDFAGVGTKEASAVPAANAKLVNPIKEGTYFTGIIRLNGAFEADTIKDLDWSNADERVSTPNGITMHTARAVDVMKGTNTTRYTIAGVWGITDPRAVTYVCIKDATSNVVSL
jgi:hypothetical protein